jgi:hypothetical protein
MEGSDMAGPSDTLGIPWPPLAMRPCITPICSATPRGAPRRRISRQIQFLSPARETNPDPEEAKSGEESEEWNPRGGEGGGGSGRRSGRRARHNEEGKCYSKTLRDARASRAERQEPHMPPPPSTPPLRMPTVGTCLPHRPRPRMRMPTVGTFLPHLPRDVA